MKVLYPGVHSTCHGPSWAIVGYFWLPTMVFGFRNTCREPDAADFRTNIMDFIGFDRSIIHINSKGWKSQARRGSPRKLDSSNVSRCNVSRRTGHICMYVCIYIYIYIYTYAHTCLSLSLSLSIYIYIYIYGRAYREPDKSSGHSGSRSNICTGAAGSGNLSFTERYYYTIL